MNNKYLDYLMRVWEFADEVAGRINNKYRLDDDEFKDLRTSIFERIAVPWRFYKGE